MNPSATRSRWRFGTGAARSTRIATHGATWAASRKSCSFTVAPASPASRAGGRFLSFASRDAPPSSAAVASTEVAAGRRIRAGCRLRRPDVGARGRRAQHARQAGPAGDGGPLERAAASPVSSDRGAGRSRSDDDIDGRPRSLPHPRRLRRRRLGGAGVCRRAGAGSAVQSQPPSPRAAAQRVARRRPGPLANSFPSGHMVRAVIAYGLIAFVVQRLAPWPLARSLAIPVATAIIVLIAFDRLYLDVHWESDVVGGVLLGAIGLVAGTVWLDRPISTDN